MYLYQDVVTSLCLDSADVVFMLLTKVSPHASGMEKWDVYAANHVPVTMSTSDSFPLQFDLSQWLNEAHPVFSERTRLLELVHGALCVCGRDPEPEFLTPFHLFAKHWTWLLRHHFPDHYSDCLRLLMTSELICSEVINCDYPQFFFLSFLSLQCSKE